MTEHIVTVDILDLSLLSTYLIWVPTSLTSTSLFVLIIIVY